LCKFLTHFIESLKM